MRNGMAILIALAVLFGGFGFAEAATLSWAAPTTYTDSSVIPGTKTKTYSYKTASAASGPWTTEGTTTALTATVSEPAAGSIKYYTVSVEIDGINSANATAVSKSAPYKTPSAPTGLTIQ